MAKMWQGVTNANTNKAADDFNASIRFDQRMYAQDILGSIAHAKMLGRQGIISAIDAEKLCDGLTQILEDIRSGKLPIDENAEDIHMFVEQVLTERLGEVGKKLHTARSRNDQVALDVRMYLRDEIDTIQEKLKKLIMAVTEKAREGKGFVCPGYTHLQRAQPILFAHHLLAYDMMFLRDLDRLSDCRKRMNVSPIGSCALSGTTYNTDRFFEAQQLGFDGVCQNSIDGVSDRDFALELLSNLSVIMTHLSRFSEEVILWSSWEFRFVSLDDAFTTGSSIMPQKRNPDMAELVRGKTGRVFGSMLALFTALKGLPLAYNKDMQEDKEQLFDACDTVKACVDIFTGVISTMTLRPENMRKAAGEGFINATDLADYLVRKGLPFRSAYKVSGQLVAQCMQQGLTLETVPLDMYKNACDLIEADIYDAVNLDQCVATRISFGGTGPKSVEEQLKWVQEQLKRKE